MNDTDKQKLTDMLETVTSIHGPETSLKLSALLKNLKFHREAVQGLASLLKTTGKTQAEVEAFIDGACKESRTIHGMLTAAVWPNEKDLKENYKTLEQMHKLLSNEA